MYVFAWLGDTLTRQYHEVAEADLWELSAVAAAVAIVLAANVIYRRWKKKKGYRMVLRDRNDKAHSILTRVINDGLFEAECAGELSNKEILSLYAECSKKWDLPDLVPKKHRLKLVKEELKARRNSPRYETERNHRPNIPGGPPTPIKRTPYVGVIGKLAARIRVVK